MFPLWQTELPIPPELIPQQPILVLLLLSALGTIWKLYRDAENECDTLRETHAEKIAVATAALTEQRILNERASATITFREFERDQHKTELDRCYRRIDEMDSRHAPPSRTRKP